MKEICRITEEVCNNPWDEIAEPSPFTPTVHHLKLADLMAENFEVWVGKNQEFGFLMDITDENGNTSYERCIHPYAMESLATFCRDFLYFYDRVNKD